MGYTHDHWPHLHDTTTIDTRQPLRDETRRGKPRPWAEHRSEAEKQAAAVAAERRIEEQQESDSLARIPLEETLAPAGEGASVRERNDDNEGFFD